MFVNDNSVESRKVLRVLEELAGKGALSFSEVSYENALLVDFKDSVRPFTDFFVVTTCDAEKLQQLYFDKFIKLNEFEERLFTVPGPNI